MGYVDGATVWANRNHCGIKMWTCWQWPACEVGRGYCTVSLNLRFDQQMHQKPHGKYVHIFYLGASVVLCGMFVFTVTGKLHGKQIKIVKQLLLLILKIKML